MNIYIINLYSLDQNDQLDMIGHGVANLHQYSHQMKDESALHVVSKQQHNLENCS